MQKKMDEISEENEKLKQETIQSNSRYIQKDQALIKALNDAKSQKICYKQQILKLETAFNKQRSFIRVIQGDMKDLSEQLKGNIQVISNKY